MPAPVSLMYSTRNVVALGCVPEGDVGLSFVECCDFVVTVVVPVGALVGRSLTLELTARSDKLRGFSAASDRVGGSSEH